MIKNGSIVIAKKDAPYGVTKDGWTGMVVDGGINAFGTFSAIELSTLHVFTELNPEYFYVLGKEEVLYDIRKNNFIQEE